MLTPLQGEGIMKLNISFVELNPTVGALEANYNLIKERFKTAIAENPETELVVFPECAISGYPVEDLLFKHGFVEKCMEYINKLAELTANNNVGLLIGTPWRQEGKTYNAAILAEKGKISATRFKYHLPNYGVFDEKRVFDAAQKLQAPVFFKGYSLGILICEDAWHPDTANFLSKMGAEFFISINGSPFQTDKQALRVNTMFENVVKPTKKGLLYVNLLGGQDELIFDGGSFSLTYGKSNWTDEEYVDLNAVHVLNEENNIYHVRCINGDYAGQTIAEIDGANISYMDTFENFHDKDRIEHNVSLKGIPHYAEIFYALKQSLKDYCHKTGFKKAVLGLSGGVDSAITAAIAVAALGRENVHAIMMPSEHTSQLSLDLAKDQAKRLGIRYDIVPITNMVKSAEGDLTSGLIDWNYSITSNDTTLENIQARLRGMILMSVSNRYGGIVLSTGNKSEVSVGYCTLYGDMVGGFNVLKDLYKTEVFGLCKWINRSMQHQGISITPDIITRPPSAELRPDQKDEDSLPPYHELDAILRCLIEKEMTVDETVKEVCDSFVDTFDISNLEKNFTTPETVKKVQNMLYSAEYKRRQACPGTKLTEKSFGGHDRRYPIINKYRAVD